MVGMKGGRKGREDIPAATNELISSSSNTHTCPVTTATSVTHAIVVGGEKAK